jgi:hypothetical protein
MLNPTAMPKTIEEINSFTDIFINNCFLHPGGGDWNLPLDDMIEISALLSVVLDTIIERSGNNSKWESTCGYECKGRPSALVEATMKKTGARCRLTLYAGNVSLSFSLPHPEELPSMDSDFWTLLSASIANHDLTYFSGENHNIVSVSAANTKLSKFVKAPLFNLVSEFTMAYQNDPERQIIGDFEKSIFFQESDWHAIIDCLSLIISDFTKLSQALYRSYYIKASKNPAKSFGLTDLEKVRPIFSWIMARTEAWTPEDVKAAFPKATAIDIRAAHHLAAERDIISGVDSKPRMWMKKNPSV